jgi:hypothetical protein
MADDRIASLLAGSAPRLPGVPSQEEWDAYLNKIRKMASMTPEERRREEARLRLELTRIEGDRAKLKDERDRVDQFMAALERLVAIYETAQFRSHLDGSEPILGLRRGLRNADTFRPGEQAVLNAMLNTMWFDFRAFADHWSPDMVDFGKELAAEGLLKLPFPTCVFVLPYVSDTAGRLTIMVLLRQAGNKIIEAAEASRPQVGKTIFARAKDITARDEVFFLLSAMASRAARVATKLIAPLRASHGADTDPRIIYTEISIDPSARAEAAGGTHASPRLHWRRGHIRRLGNRTTWIRATLVGDAGRGIVVHDYSKAPAPKFSIPTELPAADAAG